MNGKCPKCITGNLYIEDDEYGKNLRCMCGYSKPLVEIESLPLTQEDNLVLRYYQIVGNPEQLDACRKFLKHEHKWVRRNKKTGENFARFDPNKPEYIDKITGLYKVGIAPVDTTVVLAGIKHLPTKDIYTSKCGKFITEDDVELWGHQEDCPECRALLPGRADGDGHRLTRNHRTSAITTTLITPAIVDINSLINQLQAKKKRLTDMTVEVDAAIEAAVKGQKVIARIESEEKEMAQIRANLSLALSGGKR